MIGLYVPRNLHLLYAFMRPDNEGQLRFFEISSYLEYHQGLDRELAEEFAMAALRPDEIDLPNIHKLKNAEVLETIQRVTLSRLPAVKNLPNGKSSCSLECHE